MAALLCDPAPSWVAAGDGVPAAGRGAARAVGAAPQRQRPCGGARRACCRVARPPGTRRHGGGGRAGVLLHPGGRGLMVAPGHLAWVQHQRRKVPLLASVCSGALVCAASGCSPAGPRRRTGRCSTVWPRSTPPSTCGPRPFGGIRASSTVPIPVCEDCLSAGCRPGTGGVPLRRSRAWHSRVALLPAWRLCVAATTRGTQGGAQGPAGPSASPSVPPGVAPVRQAKGLRVRHASCAARLCPAGRAHAPGAHPSPRPTRRDEDGLAGGQLRRPGRPDWDAIFARTRERRRGRPWSMSR